MRGKECVAMILAGGQGSRLGVLTDTLAKPALPFGGKYRLIDFSLSNCSNSGIDTVGVLTQYRPLELHSYIGIGSPWDLDRNEGGVFILPPFVQTKGGEWYKGTANAIHQNAFFIDQYSPQYVLVLSGDHIYKMDYSLMLKFHKEARADATIAVIAVPRKEASRFGIINTDPDGHIVEFEEKPREPKNNLASMGVYIFTWDVLKTYLQQDDQDRDSAHDFGKNILPVMLKNDLKMMAYRFKGYWKDVGTIESLWEANMDLLSDVPELDLYDAGWRIFSVNPTSPPHLVAPSGKVRCSLVSVGCLISGEVENSVLFAGVEIEPGAIVKDSVVMLDAKLGAGAYVEKAIIGPKAVIEENCQIGAIIRQHGSDAKISVIGPQATIPANTILPAGAIVNQPGVLLQTSKNGGGERMKNVLGVINLHENEELLKEIARQRPLATVPFGGRFRFIDFILSNMVNSGIHAVGIMAKKQYRSLMNHLRTGKDWDLARKRDGLFLLPSDHVHYSNSIYKGDLEHFHDQADFFKKSNQDYVLIACSHIIYNFNFNEAYQAHLESRADITVLYKEEQPRPGKSFSMATLISAGDDGWVTEMEVKLGKIAGGKIGLEAFIMSKELLLQIIEDCLGRGEFDLTREGIIKNMRRYKIRGFPFRGYTAKINSIRDYYRASMELLNRDVWQELFNKSRPIYTKVKDEAPANYRECAAVSNSLVANGCIIEGRVENSLLFRSVRVHKGAHIKNSIIMQKGEIGVNAALENVICDKDVTITDGKRLSGDKNYVMVIEKGMVV